MQRADRLSRFLRRRLFVTVPQELRILLFKCRSTAKTSGAPLLRQPLLALGEGSIAFEGRVQIGYFPSPHFSSSYCHLEARRPGARIAIGDGTIINNGFVAIAEHRTIAIGRNVRIGWRVEIVDSDFHGLHAEDRSRSDRDQAAPVSVEDDVFIGANVTVLKGVAIGRGSVVASGSVVVGNVPAGVVAGGNPARVLRSIE